MTRTMLLLLAAAAGGAAFAQRGDANDPRAPETKPPPVIYRSAFEEYRPYREPEIASWRAVNEEVARVGGHIGAMKNVEKRETSQAEEKPTAGGHHQGTRR
jgi:hypothetical protein